MSIRLMASAWELDIPSTEKMVLLCLCDHSNDAGTCWPSVPTIAKKCSKSDRTVQAAIQWLRSEGYCSWDETPGRPHRFTLDPRKICTPAEVAPPKELRATPAELADEPSRTVIPKKDKPSLDKRPRETYPAPHGVAAETWRDFLMSPKRRKAGMSDTAYSGICNNLANLAEHGFPPGKMIALAVERGWVTVKLEWVLNDGRSNSLGRNQPADGLSATTRAALAVFGPDPGDGCGVPQ